MVLSDELIDIIVLEAREWILVFGGFWIGLLERPAEEVDLRRRVEQLTSVERCLRRLTSREKGWQKGSTVEMGWVTGWLRIISIS